MKNRLLTLFCLLFLSLLSAKAQCNLHPKIMPDNLVLCPNTNDTIYVTKEFDTYQWFKNGKVLKGATERFYAVNAYEDGGSLFSVSVTKGKCAGTSKKVLVDGYAFLPPTIITYGSPAYFDVPTETSVFCKYDSVTLEMGQPYTVNVQWYNNGEPIKGATNITYKVKGDGSYTACGNVEVCPNYSSCEGIPVNISFDKFTATITRSGDSLLAKKGSSYQWFVNGNAIPGATSSFYLPSKRGLYTVEVTDKINCKSTSKPVFFTPTKNLIVISPNPANDFINVHFNVDNAAQIMVSDVYGNRRLQMAATGGNQRIQISNLNTGTYVLQVTDAKGTILSNEKFMKN